MYQMTKKAEEFANTIGKLITILTCIMALTKAIAELIDYIYPKEND